MISLDGGHWFWSATLRYIYTLMFLFFGLLGFKGYKYCKSIMKEFFEHFIFWTISGTIGFGFFYALICFAADYSPAWILATTWQFTILASLFVLALFGQKLSKLIWLCSIFLVIGISMVNISHFDVLNMKDLIYGAVPVLIAGFCYPFGNQLVWQEKQKRENKNSNEFQVLNNAFVKVFLLTLGSTPLWIILYIFLDVGIASINQYYNVALIALFSGVIATTLFLYARSKANTASTIMLVDASQSTEVFFALGAEIIFLNAHFPNQMGINGIIISIIALFILVKYGK